MSEAWVATSGWIAAIISCLSFGSFAVPIKSEECRKIDVDPLVFQTYKTTMCLLTSSVVVLLGQPFYFTPWGIVSGFFWVPAGVAAIFAVKNAGLAVSQGLWSSIIVIVSFIWGIFIFHEQVKTIVGAVFAVLLMIIGLWGMSFYSSPVLQNYEQEESIPSLVDIVPNGDTTYDDTNDQFSNESKSDFGGVSEITNHISLSQLQSDNDLQHSQSDNEDYFPSNPSVSGLQNNIQPQSRASKFSKRNMGLLSAVFNGLWGGSIMVPMHYAPEEAHGIGYVISFGIGATIITFFLWIGRFAYNYFFEGMTLNESYHALPSLNFRVMWKPGGTAGLLWSIGNLASMISVQHLGEGVGYSLTQASMLVSGVWGIFYFHEVEGVHVRIKWFLSAALTIAGILMLSYEHVDDQDDGSFG